MMYARGWGALNTHNALECEVTDFGTGAGLPKAAREKARSRWATSSTGPLEPRRTRTGSGRSSGCLDQQCVISPTGDHGKAEIEIN
jgi:hypothetical protein